MNFEEKVWKYAEEIVEKMDIDREPSETKEIYDKLKRHCSFSQSHKLAQIIVIQKILSKILADDRKEFLKEIKG